MADANETFDFAVQEYLQDGSGAVTLGDEAHVEARSALEAAQRLLGEELLLDGPRHMLRAKVWRIGDDFQPVVTLLYLSPAKQEV